MPPLAALRRWRPFRSTTAVLSLSGGVTLGLMLLAGFVMLLARGDVTRDADKDALNVARAAGQDIARNLELYDLQLRSVARQMQNPEVQALPPALRRAILFNGMARDEHVGFINVLNEHGDVVADSATAVPRGGNWAGRDYFRAQRASSRDALFIGDPFGKENESLSMIPLSRRLTHPDGSFAGVVVGSVRLDYFADLFNRFSVGPHGTITLLHDNGRILQRVPAAPQEIGHVPTPNLPLQSGSRMPADVADPVDRQVRRFVLYRLEGLPLTVAVGLAQVDIYAAWNRRAAIILLAMVALGVLNAWLLLRLRKASIKREADGIRLRDQALELKQRAEQRTAMMAAQKQAHERRTRQLDEVTHDMRTALHSLLGNADLVLRKGPLTPEQMPHLASLRSAGEHLRDLAGRFLRDARDGCEADLLLEPTDIRALIGQCRSMVSLNADQKKLRVTFEADAALPDRVVTDCNRLKAILGNLLFNAIRYTDQGSVALHASLGSAGLRCVLTDTGRGMPEAQIRRLTGEDDTAGDAPAAASGMGLSIVRRHIEALGGSIRCLHNPGGGTIIILEVPVTPALPAEPAGQPLPVRGLHLLVVDDSPVSREPTADMLRAAGYRVTEASSGEEAVQQASDNRFDVALMDMRMAGMSGPETARRIRALPGEHGRTPIIALSATPRADGLAAWQQAGISDYVEKSRDMSELLHTVARAASAATADSVLACRQSAMPPPTEPEQRHLRALAEEVLAMRALLDKPVRDTDQIMLNELVHRAAGDTSQFGFTTLAAECRRYEQASQSGAAASEPRARLVREADDALTELLQRLQEARNGEARSAMPVT